MSTPTVTRTHCGKHLIQEEDEGHFADLPRPHESDQEDSRSRYKSNPKLMGKLRKLARWRIKSSLIEFPEESCEFFGGNATVSRAFLDRSLGDNHGTSEFGHTVDGEGLDSDRQTSKLNNYVREPEDVQYSNKQSGETNNGQNGGRYEGGAGGDLAAKDHGTRDGGTRTLKKVVAVKKLKIAEDTDLERVLGLALRESEFLVELSHPNIVTLEGFVEDVSNDMIWLIFPWEDNGSLRDFLASQSWEIPERVWMIDGVTRGVEYLHSRKPPICHGDLKPENILISSEYGAVITDFGSARRLVDKDLDKESSPVGNKPHPTPALETIFCATTNTITLTGNKYTIRWAAPELLMEDESSLGSDIWALGWITYEIMTNCIPFQDVATDVMVVAHVIEGELPSVADDVRFSLIQELCSLMSRCWSIEPAKRPTAGDCRASIAWMPMIAPNPGLISNTEATMLRSAKLNIQMGLIHLRQCAYLKTATCLNDALHVFTIMGDLEGKASTLQILSEVNTHQSNYDGAVTCLYNALQIYNSIGHALGRARALWGLAQIHRLQSKYIQAVTLYSEALQAYTDIGDIYKRCHALWGLAEVHRHRGEYGKAIPLYFETLQFYIFTGNTQKRACALWGLAQVYRLQSQYGKANTLYSEALQIYTEIGDRQCQAYALWGLAEVHRHQSEYKKALEKYFEALDIYADIGDTRGRANVIWSLAQVHRLRNEHNEATTLYTEALQIYTTIGDRQRRACALWGLAEGNRYRAEYSEATTLYFEALQIYMDIGDKPGGANVLCSLAQVHRIRGEYGEAIALCSGALQIYGNIGDRKGQADALSCLAQVHRVRDEYSEAIKKFSEALQIQTEINDRQGSASAILGLATTHCNQGHYSNAARLYTEAAELFEQIECNEAAADASKDAANARELLRLGNAAAINKTGSTRVTFKLVGQLILSLVKRPWLKRRQKS